MIYRYFYNLSVTIIGIVTSIFILTTVGGLFHIPVNPFYVFIPFIGGIYYLKKQSDENIDFLKQVLILLLIIFVSCILAVSVWDVSWDGRWYHTAASVMYKNGWLPVYQNYQDFSKLLHVYHPSAFWVKCYPNFVEIIGANIYKITNLIENTKATNFIILSAVFMYSVSVLNILNPKNKFLPLLCSFIIFLNPVCICQWFTNMIDLHIYFACSLLILTVLKIEFQNNAGKSDLFMFVCSSLMLAMTKYTGCMYLFVTCLVYFVYLLLLKRELKKYIKTVFVIGGLIAITGVSPFYTNFRDFGHPFHPLFGKHKINLIDESIPFGFKNMSSAERFLRVTFSESVHSRDNAPDNTELMRVPVILKIPFTINIKSFHNLFHCPDITVGGFGYFWSGILLLSLLYLPFLRFRNKNEKYVFWLVITIILSTTFANPHCWWARYVPQFWLFPVFVILFGLLQADYADKLSKGLKLFLLYFISFAFIINSLIILVQNTQFNTHLTKLLKAPYDYIDFVKKPNDKIYLMILPAWENKVIADETIIPHIEEYYGIENIIYVPYDENKIITKEFIPLQYVYIVNRPCYFFKIGK